MKIDKQLFEDVLSGKLKGTFVLRDGSKISYRNLAKYVDCESEDIYPYYLIGYSYTLKGCWAIDSPTEKDIIDFIPDTNMKENELTIEIPDGKVVDWDESKKQNRVVLKDKQLTYKDISKHLFFNKSCYTTGIIGNIVPVYVQQSFEDPNKAATKHQLECILAKNMLANVAKYLNDGWKPLSNDDIYLLVQTSTGVSVFEVANGSCASDCGSIWFKSRKTAEQAIEILGEETVKHALKPLGI